MKNVYDKITEVFVQGVSKDWEDTSIWSHEVVLDDAEVLDRTCKVSYENFADCYEAIQMGKIPNAEVGKTLFRSHPQISISSAMRDCRYTMEEKNFKPVYVRVRFELRKGLSMSYLMSNLSAEDFTDYVRAHNLVVCPMKNS